MSDFTLAGFELIEKVGEGGMGQVWKARQLSLDRLVAIKFLPPRLSHDPESIRQIIKEARTAAKLKHPGIVHVYDASEQDGHCCLVMEYVDGYTVGQWVTRKKLLSYKDALVVIESVAVALKYAWREAGLIHCDIKPENIMIDHDGTIKVADLGLSITRESQSAHQASDEIVGTPGYISPEQVRGDVQLDCRTDIYALGCCLYQMVTGERPFKSLTDSEAMEAQVSSQIPDPRDLVPGIPASVCGLIEWMLIKDREHRLADWDAVLKELHRVQKSSMFTREVPSEGASTMRRRVQATAPIPDSKNDGRRPALVRIAVILVVGVLLAAILEWRTRWVIHKKIPIVGDPIPTLTVKAVTNVPPPAPHPVVIPLNHDKEIARATKRIHRMVEDFIASGDFSEGIQWLESYSEGYAKETLGLRQNLAQSLKTKKEVQDEVVKAEADWTNRLVEITSCVLSGKYMVAHQLVDAAQKEDKLRKHQTEMVSMNRILEDACVLPDKVLKTFEPDVGRIVVIQLVRGPFTGRLIAIRDRKLVMKTMNDTAQIDVRFEELSSAERQARLLALDLPEGNLVRGVAAYNGEKDDEAEALLGKTGSVLGPMLIERKKALAGFAKPPEPAQDIARANEEASMVEDPAFIAFAKLLKRAGIDLAQHDLSKMRSAIESAPMSCEIAKQADRAMDEYLEAHGTSTFAEKHADLVLAFQSACGRAMRQSQFRP
ncbi:MAG: serine/threonine-protein kinase [bacterium]|jgi:serine/threonine protein kinase